MKKCLPIIIVITLMMSFIGSNVNAEGLMKERYKGFVYVKYEAIDEYENDCSYIEILDYKGKKKSIKIPKKIKGARVEQMLGYGNLERIYVPKGVKIQNWNSAKKLKRITVSKKHKTYSVKNNLLYNKKKTMLISALGNKKNPKLVSSVESFYMGAFAGAEFEEYTIPDLVTKIDVGLFENCLNLKSVTFGRKISFLPNDCFTGCVNLKELKLPETIDGIGEKAIRHERDCHIENLYVYNKGCKFVFNDDDESKCSVSENVTIHGYEGSTAEEYATKNGNVFVVID